MSSRWKMKRKVGFWGGIWIKAYVFFFIRYPQKIFWQWKHRPFTMTCSYNDIISQKHKNRNPIVSELRFMFGAGWGIRTPVPLGKRFSIQRARASRVVVDCRAWCPSPTPRLIAPRLRKTVTNSFSLPRPVMTTSKRKSPCRCKDSFWRRLRDSNPRAVRQTVFKTASLWPLR